MEIILASIVLPKMTCYTCGTKENLRMIIVTNVAVDIFCEQHMKEISAMIEGYEHYIINPFNDNN